MLIIYCTGNNITEMKYNIQKCMTDVHKWYESNKLVINTSKSNVMLLTTNMRDTALNVFIGNHKLPNATVSNILVSTLTMCYHGIFKLTALVRNLFL